MVLTVRCDVINYAWHAK